MLYVLFLFTGSKSVATGRVSECQISITQVGRRDGKHAADTGAGFVNSAQVRIRVPVWAPKQKVATCSAAVTSSFEFIARVQVTCERWHRADK